ncbi:hypothetical protein ACFO0J_10170 [Castellaniella hirudinis]|uniref:Uncharacterized protein n=1 Tax=Castellaniella hirudinis TaxID=1144617 RepID=A0ABV8RYQ9_9BURK
MLDVLVIGGGNAVLCAAWMARVARSVNVWAAPSAGFFFPSKDDAWRFT